MQGPQLAPWQGRLGGDGQADEDFGLRLRGLRVGAAAGGEHQMRDEARSHGLQTLVERAQFHDLANESRVAREDAV